MDTFSEGICFAGEQNEVTEDSHEMPSQVIFILNVMIKNVISSATMLFSALKLMLIN